MDIDFMRWVDRYVGVPLCYVTSLINSVTKLFKKKPKKSPEKILFIQVSEMGSAVIVSPSISYLQKAHPRAEIYYLIFEEMADTVREIGLVKRENIHTIRGKSIFLFALDVFTVVWRLRKKRIDVIIDIELFSRFSALLSYFIGAREIIGFSKFYMEGLYRGNFHTKRIVYNHTKHIGLNYLSCVRSIEKDRSEVPLLKEKPIEKKLLAPLILSDEKAKKNIFNKLRLVNSSFDHRNKIIIINPNASIMMPLRKWPLQNYIELSKRILKGTTAYIVLTGTKDEIESASQIIAGVRNNERVISIVGKTTIKELIDLYNVSDIIVTNDSGPGHFSALTNIKSIVLFGPETPLCYGPIGRNTKALYAGLMCSPCVSAYNHRKSPCNDNKCMKAIGVDAVYSEIMNFLSGR